MFDVREFRLIATSMLTLIAANEDCGYSDQQKSFLSEAFTTLQQLSSHTPSTRLQQSVSEQPLCKTVD
jgi:hypothetical protein